MILRVNGADHDLEFSDDATLVDVLRNQLGLTGTKVGCGDGLCGTCVVLVDGKSIRSCSYPARRAVGREIITIEGLAATWGATDELHPLQKAFVEHGAVQCGFCTPGMIMQLASLWTRVVEENRGEVDTEEVERQLQLNACRCTGYASIIRAFQSAVHEHRTGTPLSPVTVDTMTPMAVIGRSHPRPDSVDKVTGRARFTDDLSFPGMLYGAVLRAAHPHARILSIDTASAAALPGVRAVLTHKDVPGRNRHGLWIQDWPVLCDDKTRCMGDAVALVAADTPEIAATAASQITVGYDPLPAVDSPEMARRPESPIIHEDRPEGNLLEHMKVRRGDVKQGFAQADVIVEREYRTPTYDHMFLEPECSIAVPADYDDAHPKLTIYVGSQIPYSDRRQVAESLDLEESQVRIRGMLIGGAFGGKEDIAGQIHAALLAVATNRPVKLLYSRAESLLAHPKRHATVIRIRTGATREGKLTAVKAELMGDAGAYASLSTKVLKRATTHASGPYDVPNVEVDCYAMYTNNPPAGAFRGFGVTQSAFAVESNMDALAQELGMDPVELRRRNVLRIGGTTATGQVIRESAGLAECLDWVAEEVRKAPLPPKKEGKKTAWGFAVAYKNTGFGGGAPDQSEAEVEVYTDGSAEARCSSADLGQGLTTIMAQIGAEELGLPIGHVRVLLSDTDLTRDGGATTASRQSYVTGNATRLAAIELRKRITGSVAERLEIAPDAIEFRNGKVYAGEHVVDFGQAVRWLIEDGHKPSVTYLYQAPATKPLGEGGDMHFAFGYSAQAAQVEVDTTTGAVKVLRLVAACDAGRALNPQALLGQIEGGLVMGIGTALTEEYRLDGGVPLTLRWRDYKTPSIRDMPVMNVRVVEHPTDAGPYGAKGVGELPSIPTAPAICNAIYNAVGVRATELPVKPDHLRGQ